MTEHDDYDFENCETRLNSTGPYVLSDVIAAIHKSHANYAEMARLLGRKRSKVRDFVLGNAEAKLLFDDVREGMLDDIEGGVFAAAISGDGPSQRFVLSTIGKNRGYSTRVENTGSEGGPLRVIEETMTLEEAAEAYADTL